MALGNASAISPTSMESSLYVLLPSNHPRFTLLSKSLASVGNSNRMLKWWDWPSSVTTVPIAQNPGFPRPQISSVQSPKPFFFKSAHGAVSEIWHLDHAAIGQFHAQQNPVPPQNCLIPRNFESQTTHLTNGCQPWLGRFPYKESFQ